jgi:hypothetical protein
VLWKLDEPSDVVAEAIVCDFLVEAMKILIGLRIKRLLESISPKRVVL